MRAVIQRVTEASVRIEGRTVGTIGRGLVVLLGVGQSDTEAGLAPLLEKIVHLRVFSDAQGKMNRSLVDIAGALLIVSQFTLYADASKGRRPSFTDAADPEKGKTLYDAFIAAAQAKGIPTATGVFGADMAVSLVNDGPVTIVFWDHGAGSVG